MKFNILIALSLTTITALTAYGQKGGGGGASAGGAAAATTSGAAGGRGTVSPATRPATPVQAPGQAQQPLNVPGQTTADPIAVSPITPPGAAATETAPGTTPAQTTPNQAQTTAVSSTQPQVLAPNAIRRDQAITAGDQVILGQLRQSVFPASQPMLPWMSSVNFIMKDGAVRIVGTVPTAQDRQRIEATVQQTPGVTRVYDVLTVNPSAGAPTGNTPPASPLNKSTTPAPTVTQPPSSILPTNIGDGVPPSPRFTNIIYSTTPSPATAQPK